MAIAQNVNELKGILEKIVNFIAEGDIHEAVDLMYLDGKDREDLCEEILFGIRTYGTYDDGFEEPVDLYSVSDMNRFCFERSCRVEHIDGFMDRGVLENGYACCSLMDFDSVSDLKLYFVVVKEGGGYFLKFRLVTL